MKIEILGMGCSNCNKLFQNALEAVKQSGREVEVVKVEDIQKIMAYGVMSTPGVVIDGTVVHAGGVPNKSAVEDWLAG